MDEIYVAAQSGIRGKASKYVGGAAASSQRTRALSLLLGVVCSSLLVFAEPPKSFGSLAEYAEDEMVE